MIIAIYALLCREKFAQKFPMWRKNYKYQVCECCQTIYYVWYRQRFFRLWLKRAVWPPWAAQRKLICLRSPHLPSVSFNLIFLFTPLPPLTGSLYVMTCKTWSTRQPRPVFAKHSLRITLSETPIEPIELLIHLVQITCDGCDIWNTIRLIWHHWISLIDEYYAK